MSASAARVAIDDVTALVERVAYELVLPRWRDLAPDDVAEKGVGDLVTVVDTASEAALVAGLAEIAGHVPVIGEEGVAADPSLLDAVAEAPFAFVVDPIDGTQAFVEGLPDYAVMVALIAASDPVASWICLPSRGHTWVAERGSGVWLDGGRVSPGRAVPSPARAHIAWTRGRDDELSALAEPTLPGLGVGHPLWAGRYYTALAGGELDALGYWYGRPWDHAPGAVIVRELGGVVGLVDGRPYRAVPQSPAIVAAADAELYERVRAVMAAL